MTISSMSLGMKRNRDDVFEEKRQKTVSYAEDTHFQYMATTKSSTLAGYLLFSFTYLRNKLCQIYDN